MLCYFSISKFYGLNFSKWKELRAMSQVYQESLWECWNSFVARSRGAGIAHWVVTASRRELCASLTRPLLTSPRLAYLHTVL